MIKLTKTHIELDSPTRTKKLSNVYIWVFQREHDPRYTLSIQSGHSSNNVCYSTLPQMLLTSFLKKDESLVGGLVPIHLWVFRVVICCTFLLNTI
jgi:hypothetical protein